MCLTSFETILLDCIVTAVISAFIKKTTIIWYQTNQDVNWEQLTLSHADILKIPKSIKLLVKMKNVSFMEKTKWTFCPTQYKYKMFDYGSD